MATTSRTVAQLISDVNAVKSTSSGTVEWHNNSLQNVFVNDVIPMVRERGIIYVRTPDLILLLGATDSNMVGITGQNALYVYDSTITNASHYYAAADGGYWNRVESTASLVLNDITNVNTGTPTNGQVLTWSSGSSKWIASTMGTSFASLTDVSISGAANYQTLFRNTSGKWANTGVLSTNTATNTVAVTGSLTVSSNATVSGNISVTGTVTLSNNLTVAGTTTLNGALVANSTVVIGGAFSIGNNIDVTGDVNINSGASILDSFGNATFTGNLVVSGSATLSSTLAVSGNFAVNTNKFTVAATNGNTVVAGTLNVADDATFVSAVSCGELNVSGALGVGSYFTVDPTSGSTSISGTGTLTVGGTTTLSDTVTIATGKNLYFGTQYIRITGALAGTTLAAVGTDKYIPINFNGTSYKVKVFS